MTETSLSYRAAQNTRPRDFDVFKLPNRKPHRHLSEDRNVLKLSMPLPDKIDTSVHYGKTETSLNYGDTVTSLHYLIVNRIAIYRKTAMSKNYRCG